MSPIYLGENRVKGLYVGGNAAKTAYVGANRVFNLEGEILMEIVTTTEDPYIRIDIELGVDGEAALYPDATNPSIKVSVSGEGTKRATYKYDIPRTIDCLITGRNIKSIVFEPQRETGVDDLKLISIKSMMFPEDSEEISLFGAFQNCKRLEGASVEFDSRIVDMGECFAGSGLTTPPLAFPKALRSANRCFYGCINYTGSMLPWTSLIENAQECYSGSGVGGILEVWGESLTDVVRCFENCTNLSGLSQSLAEDPTPSRITNYADCVLGASDMVRSFFPTGWGGTITEVDSSYT